MEKICENGLNFCEIWKKFELETLELEEHIPINFSKSRTQQYFLEGVEQYYYKRWGAPPPNPPSVHNFTPAQYVTNTHLVPVGFTIFHKSSPSSPFEMSHKFLPLPHHSALPIQCIHMPQNGQICG